MQFYKMVASGNDFILIDRRNFPLNLEKLPELSKLLCRRRLSVGADGLIVIDEAPEGFDFSWHFYNSDGSRAEMCGNGARCASYYFYLVSGKKQIRFLTDAGPVEALINGKNDVSVFLGKAEDERFSINLNVDGSSLLCHYVVVGVPHTVVFVDDVKSVDVEALGRKIRYHDAFLPRGTNVDFVQVQGDHLVVRTYERGVEGETLACGTGVCASSYVSSKLGMIKKREVKVLTGGGELAVRIDGEELYLRGPVRVVYKGEIIDEIKEEP